MQPPGGPPGGGDKKYSLPKPWGHDAQETRGIPQPPRPAGYPAQPPQPQPYPPPQAQPYPQAHPHTTYPTPPAYPPPPPQQPYAHPHAPPPQAPPQAPYYPPEPPPSAGTAPATSGHGFVDFLKISLRRAFRVRIEPAEVLPQERAALALVTPPIVDPTFQAFLAWRRSVLFVVACALVPLVILRIVELAQLSGEQMTPDGVVGFYAMPVIAEAVFLAIAWMQLRRWTQWQRQRRALAIGWLIFFLAPFVVYLYPVSNFYEEMLRTQYGATDEQVQGAMMLFGVAISFQAIMTLAPKAISLIPGLIRASLVSKLLFPGTSAPGWLMILCAPIYGLLVYVALIMPYQITGSGWFVLAMIGIIGAQYFLGREGYRLARPLRREEAIAIVAEARTKYLLSMVLGGVFVIVAFGSLIDTLDIPVLSVINLVLSFEASVLMLTLITTDIVIASLDRARGLTHGTESLEAEANQQIHAFVVAAGGAEPVAPTRPPA